MKKYTVIFAILCAALLCGCSAPGEEKTSSAAPDIGSSESIIEEVSKTEREASDSTPQESTDADNESSDIEIIEKPLIENNIFSLPDGALSFEIEEGWTVEYSEVGYLFTNEDSGNSFTLTSSNATIPVANLTADALISSYSTMMEDFRLMDFYTVELEGSKLPMAYVQFSGKLNQVERETTITICVLQSGNKEYRLSFNQTVFDYSFQTVIDKVVATLRVN